jgi:hypothetical protein
MDNWGDTTASAFSSAFQNAQKMALDKYVKENEIKIAQMEATQKFRDWQGSQSVEMAKAGYQPISDAMLTQPGQGFDPSKVTTIPNLGMFQYDPTKKPTLLNTLTPEQVQKLSSAMASGDVMPSQITARNIPRVQAMLGAMDMQPGYSPATADLGFSARKSEMSNAKFQDTKVNQGNTLMTIFNSHYDPKTDTYNIPPSLHFELAMGLARMISPGGVVAQQTMDELRQATAREGLAGAAIYLGIDPKIAGGPPQDLIKFFRDNIDIQAKEAVRSRGQYQKGKSSDYSGIGGNLNKNNLFEGL